jgi:hypothetical protein
MVIGHVTWWPLTLAEQTNVWIDVKPENGHRVLMQSYPGGIESGTDWYQNDAGIVLTETTIRQTPFNPQGTPVAFRARMAIQYGGSIDEVVKQLGTRNNGLYTNEWLMGDAKTNEIAMYELGTSHTKLWRSSKNEWFGVTPGFYWGNNNAKDLTIRTEYLPDPQGKPEYIPYVPQVRDLAWQNLYRGYRGQIDEQFGYLAFRTAPLVSASTMDAKVITAEMANQMMVWAAIGKPNQREWVARAVTKNDGLYPSGYALFTTRRRTNCPKSSRRAQPKAAEPVAAVRPAQPAASNFRDRLWKGWIVPAAEPIPVRGQYYRLPRPAAIRRSGEGSRSAPHSISGLKLSPADTMNRFRIEETKGVLFLDSLRRKLGDDKFFPLLAAWFAENTTKTVSAKSFLDKAGVSFEFIEPADGPAYTVSDIGRRLDTAVLVYGTQREAGANRYAAEQLQAQYLNQFESRVPIYKDFEVNDDLLAHKDVVFVGRPEANTALAAWAKQINLDYQAAVFKIENQTHAGEREALSYAAKNPLDPAHMVLVLAGNDALRTVKLATAGSRFEQTPYVITGDARPGAVAMPAGRRRGRHPPGRPRSLKPDTFTEPPR